ncbi:hypothetical protein ABGB09_14335 [Streptomyces sp. B8F3]|uniref:hypothetical protein n=1 Tax=Streptomyces sp. B8F3 TaxID=3153573 RepID=UPI00325D87AF
MPTSGVHRTCRRREVTSPAGAVHGLVAGDEADDISRVTRAMDDGPEPVPRRVDPVFRRLSIQPLARRVKLL